MESFIDDSLKYRHPPMGMDSDIDMKIKRLMLDTIMSLPDKLKVFDIKEYLENTHIGEWNVSNVKYMGYMFYKAKSFNQDISNWDVSNVTDICNMFDEATSFNQDISKWDVSNVTDMRWMFNFATSFNQDISNWDISNVITMRYMFSMAKSFNQDISKWGDKLHPDVDVSGMFRGSGLEGNEPKWYLDRVSRY